MRDRLLDAVHTFSQALLDPVDLEDLLDRLVEQAMSTLSAEGAGILLADRHGDLGYASSSSSLVAQIERLQEKEQTGACYEAFATNRVIAAADLGEEEGRWPEYTARALGLGLRSVLGVPLNVGGRTIGVLNIYRVEPGDWTDDEVMAGEVLGALGAAYILNAFQLRAQHDVTEELQTALESRGIIERAKGLLMAAEDIDAETAFQALRQASMDSNRKLRDIAQDIVDREGARIRK